MRGQWTQLHGYYLTKSSAEAALKARRNSAWERSQYAPADRPKYRLRSKRVHARTNIGTDARGHTTYIDPGQSFYWIEQMRP